DADFDAQTVNLAFNSTDSYFMAVWRSDDNTGSLADNELEIFGQLLEAADIVDYETRGAENGPSHRISADLQIGSNVDSDIDGQPSLDSDGDDTSGSTPDDEDGLASTTVTAAPSIDITVTNNSGSAATLYGWIDYDADGLFENATERASVAVPSGTTNGTATLNFPTASGGFSAATVARFRLSTDAAAADPTGLADDGEVEDYAVDIVKASSVTTITGTNPSTSYMGSDYTVSVSVSSDNGTPTGTVNVSDGADSCVVTLSGGTGSCAITPTSVGGKTLTATYGGDTVFVGSVSSSYAHTVSKATPTATITGTTPNPSYMGDGYTVNVSVTSGSGTPTGTVNVSDGTDSCVVTLSGGTGSCLITPTSSGSKTLTATYGGDSLFNGHVSSGYSHTVNRMTSSTTITGTNPSSSSMGDAYTVSVSVSGSNGTPTGSVTVSDGTDSCVATLSSGSGSCAITSTTSGNKTLTATYAGDSLFDGSVSPGYSHTVSVPGSCQASAVSVNGPVTYSSGSSSVVSETGITTSGSVTVSSGADVDYYAPTITLSAGFSAVAGSNFSAVAQNINCP
ncbi:MAG: Ig-like domain repeat protein, partial [Chromatiales bacterium]|nr:Ig-like domain repeat protein [Chromatiales bacterium]